MSATAWRAVAALEDITLLSTLVSRDVFNSRKSVSLSEWSESSPHSGLPAACALRVFLPLAYPMRPAISVKFNADAKKGLSFLGKSVI